MRRAQIVRAHTNECVVEYVLRAGVDPFVCIAGRTLLCKAWHHFCCKTYCVRSVVYAAVAMLATTHMVLKRRSTP